MTEVEVDEEQATEGVFAGVLAGYGERGYQRGYRRAVSDALALVLLATEDYVRQHPHDRSLRSVVYAYEEHVERHLRRLGAGDTGYVSDGLGL